MALSMAALLWRKTFSLFYWKGSIIAFASEKDTTSTFQGGRQSCSLLWGRHYLQPPNCYTNILGKVFGTKSAQYIDHKMCRSTREPRRILFQGPIFPFLLLLKSHYSWDLGIHLSVSDLFLKTPVHRHWYSLILYSTFICWVDKQPIHRYILRQVPIGTNAQE